MRSGDISVVGVDDIEMARYAAPPLTTIRVPTTELAGAAVRSVIERAQVGNTAPVNVTFPVELVVRQSTATRGG